MLLVSAVDKKRPYFCMPQNPQKVFNTSRLATLKNPAFVGIPFTAHMLIRGALNRGKGGYPQPDLSSNMYPSLRFFLFPLKRAEESFQFYPLPSTPKIMFCKFSKKRKSNFIKRYQFLTQF